MRSLLSVGVLLFVLAVTLSTARSGAENHPIVDHDKDPHFTHTLTGDKPIHVNPTTHRFEDEFGREVYFHGMNVVVKGDPWIPQTTGFDVHNSFSETDMLQLQELGLNAIRLGTMWPGAEPVRGEYNMTYVNAVLDLAKTSAQYGIYSLLDMHQDVLSPKFCGEGTPLWAAIPDNDTYFPWPVNKPYKLDEDGIPLGHHNGTQCKSKAWSAYYPTVAAGSAFQRLYTNGDGLRDSWADFWKVIANATQGSGNAVLGFELINEPWAGDVLRYPEQIIPGVADKKLLQPFYEVGASKIREVDSNHIIFFEGVTWDWFYSGFTQVPGGPTQGNVSALSYHFYSPPDFSLPVQFDARQWDMKRLGCGGMLTEFAVTTCAGCGSTKPWDVMETCDTYSQSWLGWEYKRFAGYRTGHDASIWYPNGTLNEFEVSLLARTYARAVAGHQTKTSFNRTTQDFTLEYETTTTTTNFTTQIYLYEKMHYPEGFNVAAAAADSSVTVAVHHVSKNHIAVVHSYPSSGFAATSISVNITPKSSFASEAVGKFFPRKF